MLLVFLGWQLDLQNNKIYSDKWCEQAGLAACTVATTTTVNLLLPYKDTQYNIILQPNRVAQDIWGHGDTIPPESKTMNSFGIYIHSSGGSYNLFWRTGGYLTQPVHCHTPN